MKSILGLLITITTIIILVSVSGGLLVLAAYGVGWILGHILPLSPFEATLLSLIALSITGLAAWRFVTATFSEHCCPRYTAMNWMMNGKMSSQMIAVPVVADVNTKTAMLSKSLNRGDI